MNYYEIIFLIGQNYFDKTKTIIEKYTNLFKADNNAIIKIENLGEKNLAYQIKKNTKAIYISLTTFCSKDILEKLKKEMKYDTCILRNLILKIKKN